MAGCAASGLGISGRKDYKKLECVFFIIEFNFINIFCTCLEMSQNILFPSLGNMYWSMRILVIFYIFVLL
jgi:hypothetical protein